MAFLLKLQIISLSLSAYDFSTRKTHTHAHTHTNTRTAHAQISSDNFCLLHFEEVRKIIYFKARECVCDGGIIKQEYSSVKKREKEKKRVSQIK